MSKKIVKLEVEGKQYEFPVITGTENENAFDISNLRAQTGYVTMDNGYANTSACQSAITYLDGDNGILQYRGIPIEQLAEKANFLETSYLLIYGYLPTSAQLKKFTSDIQKETELPEGITKMFNGFPKDAHPMAIISSVVCALSAYYPDELDPTNKEHVNKNMIRLLGKLPTIAALAYKHTQGEGSKVSWDKNRSEYCVNFLTMMFGGKKNKDTAVFADALNLLLILHADHEQNCSTSTVRLVGSSAANLYASISAGITALWGPLHGGANQAVMEMLQEIHESGKDVDHYVKLAKDKNSKFKLMGFGHRVYKNFDPRAKIIKKACDSVLSKLGTKNPLLEIAKKLEAAALSDPYFKEKKLYPNVDFYSGIIYSALNIPVNMFTVMFALGRLPGWMAHWKEMNEGGVTKIGRPRQIYTGATKTQFTPIEERTGEPTGTSYKKVA